MSAWKVILATLVIFVAGGVTGALVQKRFFQPEDQGPIDPRMMSTKFVDFLDRELELNPEQRTNILQVVLKGQERVNILQGLIRDDLREEFNLTREEIRSLLTSEQRAKYDELKNRHRKRHGGDRPGRGPGPPPPEPPPEGAPPPEE